MLSLFFFQEKNLKNFLFFFLFVCFFVFFLLLPKKESQDFGDYSQGRDDSFHLGTLDYLGLKMMSLNDYGGGGGSIIVL